VRKLLAALALIIPFAAVPALAAADDISFSAPSGTFQGSVNVGLSTAISGAEIRYTTDGKPPTSASARYTAPLTLTSTTQVRAQAFVGGAATGDGSTGLYVARNFDARHDLPLVVIDDYGKGKPGRDFVDAAAMVINGSLSTAPAVAARAGIHLRGQSSATFSNCATAPTTTPTTRCSACRPTRTGCCAARSATSPWCARRSSSTSAARWACRCRATSSSSCTSTPTRGR
jgi:hypothetical protein